MKKMESFLLGILLAILGSQAFSSGMPDTEAFKREYALYTQLADEKRWKESLPHAKKSYELARQIFGERSKNMAAATYNYGLNLMSLQNDAESREIMDEAVGNYEAAYGENSAEIIPVLMDAGTAYADIYRERKEVMRYYNRALALAKTHYGAESERYADLSIEAGSMLLNKARSPKAKEYLYRGHQILKERLGSQSPRTGYAALNIGKFEFSTQDFDAAEKYLNEALEGLSQSEASPTALELMAHALLVETYERQDKRDLATKHCLAIGKMRPVASARELQPLVQIAPKYPKNALQKRLEGYVTFELTVDEFGFVRNPRVIDSRGHAEFMDASMKVIDKFRYAPMFKDGKAIATDGVQQKIVFELAK